MEAKPSVVFVCVANSFRSQMAEGAARRIAGDSWEIWSAGSSPSGRVHSHAIALMKEVGIDLSAHQSKGLDTLPQRQWDYVVTMGCGDNCPSLRAKKRVDWQIPDPAGLSIEDARKLRDRILQDVEKLLKSGRKECNTA